MLVYTSVIPLFNADLDVLFSIAPFSSIIMWIHYSPLLFPPRLYDKYCIFLRYFYCLSVLQNSWRRFILQLPIITCGPESGSFSHQQKLTNLFAFMWRILQCRWRSFHISLIWLFIFSFIICFAVCSLSFLLSFLSEQSGSVTHILRVPPNSVSIFCRIVI